MSVIFGGRKAEQWEGVIPFPMEDGSDYELPVVLRPLYNQNRNTIMGKVARYKRKSGMPYFNLADTDHLNARLLEFVIVRWGDDNRNPVGMKCRECGRWVLSDKEARFYEIAACKCDKPSLTDDEGKVVGARMPHDRLWPLYLIHQLQARVDDARMPRDEDGDPKRAIDLLLDKAQELAYPKQSTTLDEDDASADEVKEIEEANLASSPGSEPSTET